MFKLPNLPYDFDALHPHIDTQTMQIHHGKHHAGYVAKLNAALEGTSLAEETTVLNLFARLSSLPADTHTAVRNNGGGHANHSLFWTILSPSGGTLKEGPLSSAISTCFGSFARFKEQFTSAATTLFGSGWAWLVVDQGELSVITTPNQDSPHFQGKTPVLGLDVWEHAYYLKYQNRRPEYIEHFFSIINWEQVEKYYQG